MAKSFMFALLFAYLDPGSGSALVGTLIAVGGAAIFSLKSFFYRLLRKDMTSRESAKAAEDIAIFSEGKNYWGTFRLIVEELISRKVHFSYYTMDLHDPALLIDSDYIHAKLFDHRKVASFHKLSNIKAKVLLATTPNIGTGGYPVKRSPHVMKMFHVFHAFADCSAYHIGSLDNYDTVLTVGPHQEKPIREVEKARGLKEKELIPAGLPYFDAQYNSLCATASRSAGTVNKPTVLVAPSWGAKGCLAEYGVDFLCALARADYTVIVRPHPQSYIAEPRFLEECKSKTSQYVNIVWDAETVGTVSMEKSDILISDTSSIRFDYAFLYGKPVITLDIPRTKQTEYEGQYQSEIWTDSAAVRIGRVIDHSTVSNLIQTVEEVLKSGPESVREFRDATITNLGSSAKAIVDVMIREVSNV